MADYWKSQPRKFCQYCKCWIADNKPSVEFHERGKNHKENVAAKISEIKKKSIDKAKQEARQSKEFAAMEEAALKAYEEDLKRMEREAAGLPAEIPPQPQPQPRPKPVVINQVKPQKESRTQKLKKQEKARKFKSQMEARVWVEGRTEDGNVYYYNSTTGESKWEKPAGFQGQKPASAQPSQTESSSVCRWMEAVSPNGYPYYYNPDTGETSWEHPAGFPSIVPPGTESNVKVESPEKPSTSLPEGEEGSSEAQVAREAEVPEQESQQSNTPKISFRKRKAGTEPSEEEGEAKVSDDAPKVEAEELKKVVQNTPAEPEEKKKIEVAPVRKARRPKTSNPYGTWEKIKEEVDPYAKVDLQLPKVEGFIASAPAELPPEPKPKFRERIITSLGGSGVSGESGPASFRKNKSQNGKSRSLRQRDDDD